MNPERKLKSLNSCVDGAGVVRIAPTDLYPRTLARATALKRDFVTLKLVHLNPVSQLILSLAFIDFICLRQSLIRAMESAGTARVVDSRLTLSWKNSDGRTDRRQLSPLTVRCLQRVAADLREFGDLGSALDEYVQEIFPGDSQPLETLCELAAAHAFQQLPGMLFSHCVRWAPLAALPDSAYARRASGLALGAAAFEPESDGLGQALTSFYQCNSLSSSSVFASELVIACRRQPHLADHLEKRKMLVNCESLAQRLDDADQTSCLLVAWAADLIESGTPSKSNISPATISKYVSLVAVSLHIALQGKSITDMERDAFQHLYLALVNGASSGNRRGMASALSSWHEFLVRWLVVPRLRVRLHESVPEGIPVAQVVWAHEFERIWGWLTPTENEPRQNSQLRVAFALLMSGRFRADELFRLRLHNIRLSDSGEMEVEIAFMLRDGKHKSPSARRVISIEIEEYRNTISAWRLRRYEEQALPTDFVFGDPHYPSRGFKIGTMHVTICRLLKAASGEPAVSLHTTGHTLVSLAMESALMSNSVDGTEPSHQLATDVGHLSAATTSSDYAHCIEVPLAFHSQQSLLTVHLSSEVAAHWSGVSATALRQRAHARKTDTQAEYWRAIFDQNPSGHFLPIESKVLLVEPSSPLDIGKTAAVTFESVLYALKDVADGTSLNAIALRSNWSQATLNEMLDAAGRVANELPYLRYKQSAFAEDRHRASLTLLQAAQFSFDFSRVEQDKFSGVRKQLSSGSRLITESAANAWRQLFAGNYLSLGLSATALSDLLAFLKASGVSHELLAYSISTTGTLSIEDKARVAPMRQVFIKHFTVPPLIDAKKPRRGRPTDYLVWSSSPLRTKCEPVPAALSVAGFSALMLTYCVWRAINRESAA